MFSIIDGFTFRNAKLLRKNERLMAKPMFIVKKQTGMK